METKGKNYKSKRALLALGVKLGEQVSFNKRKDSLSAYAKQINNLADQDTFQVGALLGYGIFDALTNVRFSHDHMGEHPAKLVEMRAVYDTLDSLANAMATGTTPGATLLSMAKRVDDSIDAFIDARLPVQSVLFKNMAKSLSSNRRGYGSKIQWQGMQLAGKIDSGRISHRPEDQAFEDYRMISGVFVKTPIYNYQGGQQ